MQTDSQKLKFFTIFNHRTFFTIFTNFNAKISSKDFTGKWVWSSVSQMLLNSSPGTKIFDLETEWRFFIFVTGNLSLFPHHRAGVSMRWKLRLPFLLIYKEMQLSWRQTTGETWICSHFRRWQRRNLKLIWKQSQIMSARKLSPCFSLCCQRSWSVPARSP